MESSTATEEKPSTSGQDEKDTADKGNNSKKYNHNNNKHKNKWKASKFKKKKQRQQQGSVKGDQNQNTEIVVHPPPQPNRKHGGHNKNVRPKRQVFSNISKFFLPDKLPRKSRVIPPTKFLLGGNISGKARFLVHFQFFIFVGLKKKLTKIFLIFRSIKLE